MALGTQRHADPVVAPELQTSAQSPPPPPTPATFLHYRCWHQAAGSTLSSTWHLLGAIGKLFSSQGPRCGWVDGGTCIPGSMLGASEGLAHSRTSLNWRMIPCHLHGSTGNDGV